MQQERVAMNTRPGQEVISLAVKRRQRAFVPPRLPENACYGRYCTITSETSSHKQAFLAILPMHAVCCEQMLQSFRRGLLGDLFKVKNRLVVLHEMHQ